MKGAAPHFGVLSRTLERRQLGRFVAVGVLGLGSALSILLSSGYGCNIYNSSLLQPATEGGAHDAAPLSCVAKWPAAPLADDPDGAGSYTGFMVMQSVDVGANPDAGPVLPGSDASTPLPPIGFDLDNNCTCCNDPTTPACQTMGSCINTYAFASPVCDDGAGRDHVALNLFRVLPNASEAANAGMRAGQFSILLQISGYNGTPNDTSVTVALYVSNGVEGVQDGGAVTLKHDGTDLWTVDTHWLEAMGRENVPDGTECNGTTTCQPSYATNNAYVAGGVLVAFPPAQLPLTFGYHANFGGALMTLNDAVISGTMQKATAGGQWGIANGSISGRWPSAQLLGNLASLPVDGSADGSPSYLCKTDPTAGNLYLGVKGYVCGQQDIASQQALDNTSAACDALSMSFGFGAEPALISTVYSVPPPPGGCTSADGGAFTDNCQ